MIDNMNKILLIITIVLLSFSSCKKEVPGKAIITVLDKNNLPVYGATVNLNSDNNPKPGYVKDKKTTDNNGKTYHEFPLEVILQVKVSRGVLKAPKSHIHIIPGETSNLTVNFK